MFSTAAAAVVATPVLNHRQQDTRTRHKYRPILNDCFLQQKNQGIDIPRSPKTLEIVQQKKLWQFRARAFDDTESCSQQALSLWSGAGAVGFSHRSFLFGNAWALRSHFGVQVLVGCPFRRQVVSVENRSNRALWNARFAVDAFFRMNKQNGFTFVEAFDWTDDHAVSVFAVEAWFGYDMSH
jgi:hypothetical protein